MKRFLSLTVVFVVAFPIASGQPPVCSSMSRANCLQCCQSEANTATMQNEAWGASESADAYDNETACYQAANSWYQECKSGFGSESPGMCLIGYNSYAASCSSAYDGQINSINLQLQSLSMSVQSQFTGCSDGCPM